MDSKTIGILGAVLAVLVAAGGIYIYVSSPHGQHAPQAQQPQQPQNPQTPQQGQGGGQQGGQQEGGQGGQQTGSQQGQQAGGGQGSQGGQESQEGQGSEESKQPDLGQLLQKTFSGSYMMTGTISFKSHTSSGDSEGSGEFRNAYSNGNSMQYLKFTGKSGGQPYSGETEFLSLQKEGGQVDHIMCFKSPQTQDKWVCFKAPPQMYEQQSQSMTGGDPGKKKAEWSQNLDSFSYEGVKTIHGVAMHCWLAQYTDEEGYQVQQRMCFDAGTLQLRYLWWHSSKGGEYSQGDMFIESITSNVPAGTFTPPAQPRPYPGYGG